MPRAVFLEALIQALIPIFPILLLGPGYSSLYLRVCLANKGPLRFVAAAPHSRKANTNDTEAEASNIITS